LSVFHQPAQAFLLVKRSAISVRGTTAPHSPFPFYGWSGAWKSPVTSPARTSTGSISSRAGASSVARRDARQRPSDIRALRRGSLRLLPLCRYSPWPGRLARSQFDNLCGSSPDSRILAMVERSNPRRRTLGDSFFFQSIGDGSANCCQSFRCRGIDIGVGIGGPCSHRVASAHVPFKVR